MGGCIACHTNFDDGGDPLAGGVSITTPFGTFYSPNITSDENAGIGKWTGDDFLIAMSVGLSPDDEHYFPAFPYTAYSVMSVQELVDLKAWLDTVEPVATKAPDHDIAWHLLRGLTNRSLTGNSRGPDGESVPGITSVDLSQWSVEDLELFLEVGITLSGDFTGGHMTDVIEYGTGQMSSEDRTSIAQYLLSEANNP